MRYIHDLAGHKIVSFYLETVLIGKFGIFAHFSAQKPSFYQFLTFLECKSQGLNLGTKKMLSLRL